MTEEFDTDILGLTADIVAAHVANNRVAANELPDLISQVHAVLSGLSKPQIVAEPELTPAVPVRSSIKHDYIVCLEDGKKLKMLKRYLQTNYQMSPDEYRARWKLPRDYPMVAPAYAEQRRSLAAQIGLGRRKAAAETPPATPAAETDPPTPPRKRGRPPKVKVAVEG